MECFALLASPTPRIQYLPTFLGCEQIEHPRVDVSAAIFLMDVDPGL
jgi:hypothetical protein